MARITLMKEYDMNVPLRTTGYKPAQRRCFWLVPLAFMAALSLLWSNPAYPAEPGSSDELQVEITKKGLGKEAVLRKGAREWYMMIEVTPENTVVVRQEKENETYLVDESETHDRAMTSGEVDVAITDFVNSVKTQVKQR